MCIRKKHLSPFGYTIYAFIGTVIEQAALFTILRWGLPHFNIHIPLWGIVILMLGLLVYSFYTYRMGRLALSGKPLVAPEAIIGCEGIVATPLDPKGFVKVKNELWRATSESSLEVGDEIIVTGIDGIKLKVIAKKEYASEVNG